LRRVVQLSAARARLTTGTAVAETRRRVTERETCDSARRIVVVDDEAAIVFALQEFLEQRGFAVDTASNANDAWAHVVRSAPDLVCSDLHLTPHREGDGLRLLARVRSQSPRTRTVLLTAFADDATRREAERLRIDAVYGKPIDLPVLSDALDTLVETRHRHETARRVSGSGDRVRQRPAGGQLYETGSGDQEELD
jgi:DNA-binding NtrC family response regulator